jgi:hypothetical protein
VGDVVSVGFPSTRSDATGMSGVGTVRVGACVPVMVDLTLEQAPAFDGIVQIRQRDRDGDIVCDELPVNLRLDGVAQQRYTLYIPANPGSQAGEWFEVMVLDEQHRVVEVFSSGRQTQVITPTQQPIAITDDECLILAVSSTSVGKVLDLQDKNRDTYARPPSIARVDPKSLPAHWCGLETVDYIVWDDADSTQVSADQLTALINWTRQGGVLLVAAVRTASALRQSPLNEILPVDIGTEKHPVTEAHAIRRKLLGGSEEDTWRSPVDVVTCTPRASVQTIPSDAEPGEPVLYSRSIGRGRVIFCPMLLKDIFAQIPQGGSAAPFFQKVFMLRPALSNASNSYTRANLFPVFERMVGFRDISGAYFVFALVFAILYSAGATFGSWSFLRRRGWTRHSWSAFAAIAVVASVLSVFGVQAIHGTSIIKPELRQLTIVDVHPDDVHAYATAYFGVKTSLDRALDLYLPSDPSMISQSQPTTCILRPMPVGADQTTLAASYTDPRPYRIWPSSARIENVPVRATLKQLEGRWEGTLRGRISAAIRLQAGETKGDVRIRDDSWIRNELGIHLRQCFVVQPVPDLIRADRAAMLKSHWDQNVYVYPIGDLPGGRETKFAVNLYQGKDGTEMPFDTWKDKLSLEQAQRGWSKDPLSALMRSLSSSKAPDFGLSSYQDTTMLLTTVGFFEPQVNQGNAWMGASEASISRARARQLDLSDWIDDRHVLLVGFADEPGPVRLCYGTGDGRYEPILPSQAWTVYRVLLPIEAP